MGRLIAILLVGLSLVGALAWTFQDEIGLWVIDPNRSYEAYTPPPPPNYADPSAWLAREDAPDAPADIFFIHNNVYRGDGQWNAPFDRDTQLPFLRDVLLPLEAGPFDPFGALWAPRYRQATFYARFTQKQPGVAARDTAYRDVAAAFEQFLAERDPEQPFFLVGYGDGALFVGRLLEKKIIGNEALEPYLAAAYALEMPLSETMFGDTACTRPDQARCLVAFTPVDTRFTEYQERLRAKTLTLRPMAGYQSTSATALLCNPPRLSETMVALEGKTWSTPPAGVAPQCEDGLLIVPTPEDRQLRQRRFFGQQWYPDHINLFFGVLQQDAGARLEAVIRNLSTEANTAPPMMEAEDIEDAPINVVPNRQ
ncbi:MAG: DUF3089 domain-containing protein [Pseudomonadota bacterium]